MCRIKKSMARICRDGNGCFDRPKILKARGVRILICAPLVVALINTSSINSLGNWVGRNPCA
jgi:hypothetical protein